MTAEIRTACSDLPARAAEALARVNRPRAVAIAADLPGLRRAVERCDRSGYHLAATTGDPATALRMLVDERADLIVADRLADLPMVEVVERAQRVPPAPVAGAPIRERRPQPIR
jgi:hypothetical protein